MKLYGDTPGDLREMLIAAYLRPLADLAIAAGSTTVTAAIRRPDLVVELHRSPNQAPRWEGDTAWLAAAHHARFGDDHLDPGTVAEAFGAVEGTGVIRFAILRRGEVQRLPLALAPEAPRPALLELPGVATVGEGLRNLDAWAEVENDARTILWALDMARRGGPGVAYAVERLDEVARRS